MAAPSSTVPGTAAVARPSPTDGNVGLSKYVQEFVAGTAMLLQEIPPEVLPVLGAVCKTFLTLEQLVETATSNKKALSTLRKLCDVVIKGFLAPRTGHPWLPKGGFEELQKHVERVEKVAKLCRGAGVKGHLKRFVLARTISDDIAAIRSDVLAFCSVNNLVLADDSSAKIDRLASDLDGKLETMKELTVTQAEYEAMEKELEKEVEAKEVLEAELRSRQEVSDARATELEAALVDSKETLAAMKAELDTLAAMKSEIEEQRRVADLASRVKVPSAAPRIQVRYVERKAIVSKACDRLGIRSSSAGTSSAEPRLIGLAGPSGAGKSTVASMVVRREEVRAAFHKGVLWLQVGQGAKGRLTELMYRLAGMVYETVMQNVCRPPRKQGIENDPEDGVAYIREVVDESSRRFLVVADDVWEVEVLEELKRAGVWVIYTTRDGSLLPDSTPLRLDQVLDKEAELVLRRAAELDDDAHLPDAAYKLMSRSECVVLDLAFVGRWSVVRGRNDEQAWQRVLNRILEAQKKGEGEELLPWRVAVLRGGLEELACDNVQNKELYLSLAVIPKGVAFPSEVAAILLYGDTLSAEDLEAAAVIAATLERWSILMLEDGGKYRIHDQHADFIRGRFTANQDIRDRALPSWRGYISSVQALLSFSYDELVQIWEVFAQLAKEDAPSRPFEAALDAMDPLGTDHPAALNIAAHFHWRRGKWLEAFETFSRLLVILENLPGGGKLSWDMTYNLNRLTILEKKLGLNHPDVATTLHNLGVCAYNATTTEEAEKFHRRALEIQVERLGVDHPDVATTLHNLGLCAWKAGRTDMAEKLYRRALTIREEKLGVNHLDVVPTLNELGVCALQAERVEEAEEFHRRALEIREEKLGVDHLDVATTLHNLGACAYETGRTGEAEHYYRRVLTIREQKLGANHPDVARTLNELGVCASKVGRTDEADELHRRALTIREEKLGVDHLDVAATLHGLGVCALRAGKTEEAEEYHRRVLTIREEKLGVDHPDVARTLNELAVCASKAGRTEEAEELCRQALAIRETPGVDHLDVARILNNLAVCASNAGNTEEAEELYRRVLTVQEKKLGVDHLDVANTLFNLGACALQAGKTEEAEEYHRRALTIREEKLGVDHPDVANTLSWLGSCALRPGKTEEAEQFYRRALEIWEGTLGVDHPDVASTLFNLGVCTLIAGKIKEAEKLYRRALAIMEEELGVDHPDVATTLSTLGLCASNAGRMKEAEKLYRRALKIREDKLGIDHPLAAESRRALAGLRKSLSSGVVFLAVSGVLLSAALVAWGRRKVSRP